MVDEVVQPLEEEEAAPTQVVAVVVVVLVGKRWGRSCCNHSCYSQSMVDSPVVDYSQVRHTVAVVVRHKGFGP
jgi:ethanolamine ammonia-lyase small subunit